MEGFLDKRSPFAARKLWQRRWFILKEDTLHYFKEGIKVGEIILKYHTIVQLIKKKVTFLFFLKK